MLFIYFFTYFIFYFLVFAEGDIFAEGDLSNIFRGPFLKPKSNTPFWVFDEGDLLLFSGFSNFCSRQSQIFLHQLNPTLSFLFL